MLYGSKHYRKTRLIPQFFLNSSEPRNIMKIYSSVAKTDESVTMDENRPHMFVS
jgi:hypothetical protein